MVIRRFLKSVIAACVFAVAATNADAGVKLTYGSPVSISAGGTAYMDVFVESDTAVQFDSFSAEFQINNLGPALAGGVRFTLLQSDSQLAQTNYVHYKNSLGSPIGNVSGTFDDIYIGGDATADSSGTLLSAQKLLFRLDLSALLTAIVGDDYLIQLADHGFSALDENGLELDIDAASYTNAGLVTVTAAPVPEPGSASVFAVLAGLAVARRGVRRFRNAG